MPGRFTGENIKIWLYNGQRILLKHDLYLQRLVVQVDRVEMLSEILQRSTKYDVLPFKLRGHLKVARIHVRRMGVFQNKYQYDCDVDGIPVPPVQPTPDILHVRVLTASTCPQGVGMYTIQSHCRGGYSATVQRRYSEFAQLHQVMKTLFRGTHLATSLPQLPGKKIKWRRKHESADFLEQRRLAFQSYLARLVGLPRAVGSFEFMVFLQLDPVTGLPNADQLASQARESCKMQQQQARIPKGFNTECIPVLFHEPGPLGLDLSIHKGVSIPIVANLKSSGVTSINFQTSLENVEPGYGLYQVQDALVVNWTLKQVSEMIQRAPRPIKLGFVKPQADNPAIFE